MSFSALRALHASIGNAIDDLERIYADRSQSEPLHFPHLEDPYYTSATHSEEESLAHQLDDDPAVSLASKKIVAACGQLSATVNKPWYGLMEAIQAVKLIPSSCPLSFSTFFSGSIVCSHSLPGGGSHPRDSSGGRSPGAACT